jgi:hypothetical protein
MAKPARLREILVNDDTTFCQYAEAPGSNTYDTRLKVQSYTLETSQERIRDGAVQSRSNAESLSHLGSKSASLEITMYLGGHDSDPTGALTATALYTLLKDAMGGGNSAQVGGTVNVGTSATQFSLTAATLVAGAFCRVGDKTDARGNGQALVVNNAATATVLTALGGTPSTGDVIRPMLTIYPDESTLTTLTAKRFLIATTTTSAQYHVMGAQLASITFNTPIAGLPTVTLRYLAAYWQKSAVSTPGATALSVCTPGPTTGGSCFIQDFGTATRATLVPSSINFSIDLGLEPIRGLGGLGTYQEITGWVRTQSKPSLSMRFPYTTDFATRFNLANASYTYYHVLLTLNAIPGRSVAVYMPRAFQVGNSPEGVVEENGQDYVELNLVGTESTTETTELTRSAWRIGLG